MPTSDNKPIRKCVCFDVTFAALRDAGVKTLEEAGERFGCGTNCGLCRPFVVRMIETGETVFAVEGEG